MVVAAKEMTTTAAKITATSCGIPSPSARIHPTPWTKVDGPPAEALAKVA
jgi:hypothetical protein